MISFRGYCASPEDAALLFFCTTPEGSAKAHLVRNITRRLYASERDQIAAGCCYVFNDVESGMKRWTDGMKWSKSRVVGQFLVYRRIDDDADQASSTTPPENLSELAALHSAKKRRLSSLDASNPPLSKESDPLDATAHSSPKLAGLSPKLATLALLDGPDTVTSPELASYDATLVEDPKIDHLLSSHSSHHVSPSLLKRELDNISAPRKLGSADPADELCKKTFSMSIHGTVYHLICYYTDRQVAENALAIPSSTPEFMDIVLPPFLTDPANYRLHPKAAMSVGARKKSQSSESAMSAPASSRPRRTKESSVLKEVNADQPHFGSVSVYRVGDLTGQVKKLSLTSTFAEFNRIVTQAFSFPPSQPFKLMAKSHLDSPTSTLIYDQATFSAFLKPGNVIQIFTSAYPIQDTHQIVKPELSNEEAALALIGLTGDTGTNLQPPVLAQPLYPSLDDVSFAPIPYHTREPSQLHDIYGINSWLHKARSLTRSL
ncbi:hypothetical protein HDU91_006219 [Kappamyces sp. JEL0680]|nr:hypothetical protein HDU91_006219 [Kappamyces sp. JEL0680]